MKKVFNELFLIFFVVFLLSLNALAFLSNKTHYEDLDIRRSMSTDETEMVFNELDGVVVRCKLNYELFKYNKVIDSTLTDVKSIREERRELNQAGKVYHSNRNVKINKGIGDLGYEYCYVSTYSPYIEFGFKKEIFSENYADILKRLDRNSDISDVYVIESSTVREENLIYSSRQTGAYEDFSNRYVTGDGVRVGLLETGIINKNHVNIAGSNYVIESYIFNVKKEHATQMASLIAGNNGLACDATIYSSQAVGTLNSEFDWFVENDVDIVNMSFSEANPTGIYGNDSAVADYYAKTYGMLLIASAGNDGLGNDLVGNPGLGYNVLTVASVDYDNSYAGYSSSATIIGPQKPTLCMYGDSISVPNYLETCTGTSYSAALTSGTMAMIYELYPELKNQPERAIALATANTLSLEAYPHDVENGLNDYVGAGVLRYGNMKNNYSNSYLLLNSPSTGPRVAFTIPVEMTCLQKIKICLTWFADATGDPDETTFNDYDIRIYDGNGTYVATSTATESNLEILEYRAARNHTYTIKIYQYDTITSNQRLGLAFQVYD